MTSLLRGQRRRKDEIIGERCSVACSASFERKVDIRGQSAIRIITITYKFRHRLKDGLDLFC